MGNKKTPKKPASPEGKPRFKGMTYIGGGLLLVGGLWWLIAGLAEHPSASIASSLAGIGLAWLLIGILHDRGILGRR